MKSVKQEEFREWKGFTPIRHSVEGVQANKAQCRLWMLSGQARGRPYSAG